jgi:hypothetical protein
MRRLAAGLAFAIAMTAGVFTGGAHSSAHAASPSTGSVVYSNYRCDYFIVESMSGFALLEWFSGAQPDAGNVLIGQFESYGMPTLFNRTSGSTVTVWVEDYWLSKQAVINSYFQKCRILLQ